LAEDSTVDGLTPMTMMEIGGAVVVVETVVRASEDNTSGSKAMGASTSRSKAMMETTGSVVVVVVRKSTINFLFSCLTSRGRYSTYLPLSVTFTSTP
jgi:hypothetical protein